MKISNGEITASFKSQGAELTSLKKNGVEYVWQADPKHWNRHAPVLFPFVGKLKDNQYKFEDKIYQLGQHGFARDMEFEIKDHQSDSISFLLKSNIETLVKYPFPFELTITYSIRDSVISTQYEVFNATTSDLYFSIGGHPAFNCPMDNQGVRSDYWLQFNTQEQLESHLIVDGLFDGNTEQIPTSEGKLLISDNLFDKDALVFKNLTSNQVSLESATKKWITFHFEGFPYLGIWSKSRQSPFVCIEPWFGLADHSDHNGDFTRKEGIQILESKSVFSCVYRVEVH